MKKRSLGFWVVFTLVALVVGFGRYFETFAVNEVRRITLTKGYVEQSLHSSGFQAFKIIKENFPTEYDELIEELTHIGKTTNSTEDIIRKSQKAVAEIRRTYAEYIEFAPDDSLVEVLLAYKALYEQILKNESWQICNQVVYAGAGALNLSLLNKYKTEIDTVGTQTFEAIALGASAQSFDDVQASEEDFTAVYNDLLEFGFSEENLLVLETGDVQDPFFCPVMITLLESLINQTGPEGQRVRASFVSEITANE